MIGLLHGAWYRGDVLEVLALMGLFLVPFYRVRSNTLLIALGVFFLAQPILLFQIISALNGAHWANQQPGYWDDVTPQVYLTGHSLWETLKANATVGHTFKWLFMYESGRLSQIMGLSLLGLVLGRVRFFREPERLIGLRFYGLIISGLLAFVLYHTKDMLTGLMPATEAMFMPRSLWGTILSGWFDVSLMAFMAFGFMSLYYGLGHRILNLLAPAGRMTLTFYVLQSLIFVPVFYSYGLGLHATMSQTTAIGIAVIAFILQVMAAHLWFKKFLYGPLEWLWRAATYLTLKVPFIRQSETKKA
ncbi:MAG: DUF418 domain-containing protein [Asticcacaulis sp.]